MNYLAATDEQLRVRVAEIDGWKLNDDWERPGVGKWWEHAVYTARKFHELPDYPDDLNAVARVEAKLTDEQHFSLRSRLAENAPGRTAFERQRNYVSATARQRCIALCMAWETGLKDE
jgi:hypothetical protein